MALKKINGSWHLDYRANGRRIREKVGTSKQLAKNVLAKRLVEIAEGRFLDVRKEKTYRFADVAEKFLSYSETNKRSFSRDVLTVRNHLLPALGQKLLQEISSWDVEKYKAQRKAKVKPSSVNRELACLKTIFNKAIHWGMTSHNPVRGIKFFKESQRDRFLMPDEIQLLLAAYPSPYRPLVVMALNTGMRLGEILGLSWDDVDFRKNQITVQHSKNGESRRIEMNADLSNLLLQMKKESGQPLVFPGRGGNRITDSAIGKVHRKACAQAGITDFRFHDLRHTFASHLVMNGVDLTTVGKLLGHKSFQMTLRYSHLSQAHKQKAVDTLVGLTDGHFLDTQPQKVVGAQFGNGS